ncbi:MAG TPA: ArnT family glycosyltransferase [Xylella sp.]
MTMQRPSYECWLLLLVALLVLGTGLGLRDPHPADEPRFALVAKQMVDSGEWLFPHRGHELYSDKPPMLMWWQAAFYILFGNLKVAFLLPSLLAALGTLACVYDLGRRLWTHRIGLYAAYALLFTLHFTYQAKRAQIDALVMFFITFANYGLLRHVLCGGHWRWWVLGWFAAGLGTITKGVGALALLIVLPAGMASLAGWPRVKVHVRDARFWLGPLGFLVAVSLWLVPMVITALFAHAPEYRAYLNDILLRQTVRRYTQSWDHPQPPWYFLQVMLTVWMPTLLALPWALPAWWRRCRRRDPRYLVPLVWWLLLLVFFSIPSGKRDVYILPALPMVCLALAPLLPGLLRKRACRRLLLGFGVVLVMVLAGFGVGMLIRPDWQAHMMSGTTLTLEDVRVSAWAIVAVASWGGFSLLAFGRSRPYVAVLSLLTVLWLVFGLVLMPVVNNSSSARAVMMAAGQRIGPEAELGLVAWKEQHLLMADRPVATFGFVVPWDEQLHLGIAWQSQWPRKRWLLVEERAMLSCIDRSVSVFVGSSNRRAWWLVPAGAVHGDCLMTQAERDRLNKQDDGRFD